MFKSFVLFEIFLPHVKYYFALHLYIPSYIENPNGCKTMCVCVCISISQYIYINLYTHLIEKYNMQSFENLFYHICPYTDI